VNRRCCEKKSPAISTHRRAAKWFDAVGWLVPATALALMPKCPMCVAAYVALATGLGVSLPLAAAVRTMLIVFCATSLAFMAARSILRAIAR
jgi:hypothetical protein